MSKNNVINVEVIYLNKDVKFRINLDLTEGSTVQDAIDKSKVLEKYPEIDLANFGVGVFSRIVNLSQGLKSNDRIEIYPPLKKKKK